MKNQLINTLNWVLGGGILCVLLCLPELWISKLITQNNSENFQTYFTAMLLLTMCVYVIILMVKIVQYKKRFKEYRQETLREAKGKLSSEFTTVLLNSSVDISKEKFECQAKVDNDGKIICKIHVDFETKIDSYEEFLRYFHFNEE